METQITESGINHPTFTKVDEFAGDVTYDIKNGDQKIGRIVLLYKPDLGEFRIEYVSIKEKERGKGFGRQSTNRFHPYQLRMKGILFLFLINQTV